LLDTFASSLVPLPAASIELRDARRHRRWRVTVEPYALARHPVTRGQYYGVLHDAPYREPDEHLPLTDVPWEDAVRFCNHLPTWAGLPPATRSQQTAKHTPGMAPPRLSSPHGGRMGARLSCRHRCTPLRRTRRHRLVRRQLRIARTRGGHETTERVGRSRAPERPSVLLRCDADEIAKARSKGGG